jgi:hypothetical protein
MPTFRLCGMVLYPFLLSAGKCPARGLITCPEGSSHAHVYACERLPV